MAVYRYSPESVNVLTRAVHRHHTAVFVIFGAVVCGAGIALYPIRKALICDAIFCLALGVVIFGTRHKAWQRTANWIRSIEVEIDDEKVCGRSKFSNITIPRAEITEARFTKKGIWLRGASRRTGVRIPPQIEGFDELATLLNEWVPRQAIRPSSAPSDIWTYLQFYGTWIGAAALLYTALSNQKRGIAVPACVLAATGAAWYMAWCGRKIDERKWKVLLPLTGYLLAAVLLGRAFTLWVAR